MFVCFTFVSSVVNLTYSKQMEQHTLKNINNCLNTNIYSYLKTSGVGNCNSFMKRKISVIIEMKLDKILLKPKV